MFQNTITFSLIIIALLCSSCKRETRDHSSKEIAVQTTSESNHNTDIKELNAEFMEQTVNDSLAEEIKNYITTQILGDGDLKTMAENDRKFQFHQIDLNNDGKTEVFVKFISSYFCGSGGCTMLLFTNDLKPVTKFTVMRTPLFAEKATQNDWKILLIRSEGEFKELIYKDGTYPSNPSVLENSPFAPSGHAEVMFDNEFSKPKTYYF